MVRVQVSEKITPETFIDEHRAILKHAYSICEFASDELAAFRLHLQCPNPDADRVEKIVSWKSNLKLAVWSLANFLQDHVERETAFLGTFAGNGLEPDMLQRNEDVLEHLGELTWLLDNTPARRMSDFLGYLQMKVDELYQGITEHCSSGTCVLKTLSSPRSMYPD